MRLNGGYIRPRFGLVEAVWGLWEAIWGEQG